MGIRTNGETFCKDVGWASKTPRGMTPPWCQADPSQDRGKEAPAIRKDTKTVIKLSWIRHGQSIWDPINVAAVVNCTLHLGGFLQWSLVSSPGKAKSWPTTLFCRAEPETWLSRSSSGEDRGTRSKAWLFKPGSPSPA